MSEITYISTQDDFQLSQTCWQAKNQPKGVILYFHGGGLIFGQSDDLNKDYIDLLTEDFTVISADYRLAPESSIDTILSDVLTQFDAVEEVYQNLPIFLFGRSAGSFLAMMVASKRDVKGILDFYGYSRFHVPAFIRQNQQYLEMSKQITPDLLQKMIQKQPLTKGDLQTRYLIYLYARGQNEWLNLLGITHSTDSKYNLSPKQLQTFPPTFIVHGKNDPDVPFSEATHLERNIPQTKMIALDDDSHDFDREVNDENLSIYRQAHTFLLNLV